MIAHHQTKEMPDAEATLTGKSADLRRQQLIAVASDIIASEGCENLKHSLIAERAGCTRPLVYRYFPRKHDIYIAITADFYDALDRQLSIDIQSSAITGMSSGNSEIAEALITTLWKLTETKGLAAISLRSAPLLTPEFAGFLEEVRRRYEHRWVQGYQALGLSREDAELLIDNCICCLRNGIYHVRTGRLTQPQALAKVQKALKALLASAV